MSDQKDMRNEAAANPEAADDRFRYIGFSVYPGKIKEFWHSDAEKNSHLARVKETAGRFVPLSRANSFVSASALSLTERIILTICSLALVVAPFLPWFSFTRAEQAFSYSGISLAMNAGSITHFLGMGSGLLSLSFYLLIAVMFASWLFGLLGLWALNTGASGTPEAYVARLKRVLIWQYLPILGWVVFFSLTAAPTEVPFAGSLGLAQLEHSLNIGTLSASASVGFWLPFAALWVGAIKGNDL
jgi:hypothetical protein